MQLTIALMPRIGSDDLHIPKPLRSMPGCPQNASLIRKTALPRSFSFARSPPTFNQTACPPGSYYTTPHFLSPHQNLTKLSPPILSPLFNSADISTLNGLSTSGCASNWWMASNVDESVYAGDHDVFKRSRQISPVLKSTFG